MDLVILHVSWYQVIDLLATQLNNIIRKRNFLLHLFTKLFSILVQGWKQGQDKPLKGTL